MKKQSREKCRFCLMGFKLHGMRKKLNCCLFWTKYNCPTSIMGGFIYTYTYGCIYFIYIWMCVCVCMLVLHKPLKTPWREVHFPGSLPNSLKSWLKHLNKSQKAKRYPKWHFLKCFSPRNITRRNGVVFTAQPSTNGSSNLLKKSQTWETGSLLVPQQYWGCQELSSAPMHFYWCFIGPASYLKVLTVFDSYELAVISPCSYFLIFSAFCPLPSHLTPANIPAAEEQVYKATS